MDLRGTVSGTSFRYTIDLNPDDANREGCHVNIVSGGSRVGRLEIYSDCTVHWSSKPDISHNMQIRIEKFFEENASEIRRKYDDVRKRNR